MVKRSADHPLAAVRLQAAAQLVDPKVGGRDSKRSRDLLLRRLKEETDPDVLERVVESLQSYPTQSVREAIEPFTRHPKELVSRRATMVLNMLDRQLGNRREK